jgi:hypothetical protein
MKEEESIAREMDSGNSMDEYVRTRVPIAEWPDIERKMAIISRMTTERS